MKKGILVAALLILLAVMLSGCNLIGHDDALDEAQVVATVNGKEITKGEWKSYRDSLASYYQQLYQQYYGITVSMTDADVEAYGEQAIEQLVQSNVIEQKMEELGLLPLTEEENSDVESYADSMFDMYKLMLRYQNYPDIETVEEEQERLAADVESAKAELETAKAELAAAEAAASDEVPETAEETETEETAESVASDDTQAVDVETAQNAVSAAEEKLAAAEEAEKETKATVTDAELDAMLTSDLEALGYTREYFVESRKSSVENDKLTDYINQDVTVSDEEVKAEFDSKANEQKETYDATPTAYYTAVNNNSDVYYVPEGYRGVKNLLIQFKEETRTQISDLESEISTAQSSVTSLQSQLDSLMEEDASDFDEETLTAYNEQKDTLEQQIAEAQATVDQKTPELEALREKAYEEIQASAEDLLARALAGDDFDILIDQYGEDTGMQSEPAKTRGYLVCEGLEAYVPEFQAAAMALENVGDITQELVKTEYGYHILQYAQDIPSGVVEYTDEIKESIHDELLEAAQDAAYTAAIEQWVADADVKTYPKIMK